MCYDVAVIKSRDYEGIMRLPLNVIYFAVSCWQVPVTRCTLLWCDTNGCCCLQKDLLLLIYSLNLGFFFEPFECWR